MAKEANPTATAAVKPSMVLTNNGDGRADPVRVERGSASAGKTVPRFMSDDTTGMFPMTSRRPVKVCDVKPCGLGVHGRIEICDFSEVELIEPVLTAHT